MFRSRLPALALALAPAAQEPARLARDPDRGLEPGLRAQLARVDPLRDTWKVEQQMARLAPRLATLSARFADGELATLADVAWIERALRVATLAPRGVESARGPWRVRATAAEPDERELTLAAALAAWRAEFTGAARLELEAFELGGDERALTARIRATATGTRADARAQHEASWNTTWRLSEERGAELVALTVERCTSVALDAHPAGLFRDVTVSALGADFHAREVAPGLDHWRATLATTLEPGQLGHHGLALGDVDGDGREDLYWCRPGGLPNRLFLRNADDTLREVSAAAGVDLLDYSSSALLADFDGDLDADLVVATATALVFFANDGAAHFTPARVLARSLATSLAAADFDLDGDLDLYACSYVSPYEASGTPVPYHDANNGEANWLLRNEGGFEFREVAAELGLDANNRRFSLAAAWEDFDLDGDADLYVANDFGRNNFYQNDGGRFRDVAEELGALDVSAGMGVTWGDVSGDGRADLYVTNLYSSAGSRLTAAGARGESAELARFYRDHAQGNTLLLSGGPRFRDASEASGTFRGRWGWGGIFLDLDDDAELDLFAPNGFVTGTRSDDLDSFFWRQVVLQSPAGAGAPGDEYTLGWSAVRRLVRQGWSWNGNERNAAFLGLGAGDFVDVSDPSGLALADDARAAARVDLDDDGDEDLWVTNRSAPMLRLLRNEGTGGAWIAFELAGEGRTPVGARVEVRCASGRRLVRSLRCGEGYLAQSSARLHFGLGAERVEHVQVYWPGAREPEDFGAPAAGAIHRLVRGRARAEPRAARSTPSALVPSLVSRPAPPAATRTVLPEPLALPRLALETMEGGAASLLGITPQGPRGTGKALVLLVWSVDEPVGCELLARCVADAASNDASELQLLALSADVGPARARAQARLAELAWPFGAGFASEEALQVLELVSAALHDDARALPLPGAFLVDPAGRLQVVYAGQLEPAAWRADRALFALTPEARRAACVPFSGRWRVPPSGALADAVAARLAAHGLARPAGEYELARIEVRAGGAALQLEAGLARQREGQLVEAIGHYRRALEADPSLARAAQNLAVALHQNGEREAALAAYKEALKLDPAHARTRHNLGLLYLERGELEAARQELAALRNLKSELADQLAESIRRHE